MPTPPASNGRQTKRTSTTVSAPARADILDLDELQAGFGVPMLHRGRN